MYAHMLFEFWEEAAGYLLVLGKRARNQLREATRRVSATSVCSLQLLVYAAFSY